MSKVAVYNIKGEQVSELELNPAIFGMEIKPELVSWAIVAQQANSRQVLAHTKNRGEVAGGGRKPWRQKGTGRARHGSIRSPLWRGGGITFGPTKERNFSVKINKKSKQKAILMSLTDKAKNQKLVLLDELVLPEVKTKKFFEILQNLKLRNKKANKKVSKIQTGKKETKVPEKKSKKVPEILLVLPKKDGNVERAARNIFGLKVITANSLNVFDIMRVKYLLMPVGSIPEIEKTFVK